MPVFSFSAKKYFRFFVYFILFYPPFLQATIHTVYNFDKLKEEIEKLDEKALVIFDVDDVILHPKDHILRSVSDTYRAALSKKISLRFTSQ